MASSIFPSAFYTAISLSKALKKSDGCWLSLAVNQNLPDPILIDSCVLFLLEMKIGSRDRFFPEPSAVGNDATKSHGQTGSLSQTKVIHSIPQDRRDPELWKELSRAKVNVPLSCTSYPTKVPRALAEGCDS